jgi:4-hydroxy-tetrahydrodipicolinate reductase
MAINFAIAGAAGRMGRRIIALASADPELQCVAALEASGSSFLGKDAGELAGIGSCGVRVAANVETEFDVLIDFSTAAATCGWLDACERSGKPIVIGTTGHSEMERSCIAQASNRIAVLQAPNMSVGVNVMLGLVEQLARTLDPTYDVEIVEAHHRFKTDAPSGTAIALADAVARGRGGAPAVVHGRTGATGQRPSGQIGVHSLRIGNTVGEHSVSFGSLGETITIGHTAHSRDTFVAGALRAAKWIVGKPHGLYAMSAVLSK